MQNKKIGIVTIYDANYGNRLQNYALQQVIKEMGNEVESIYFKDISKSFYIRKTQNPIRKVIKCFVPTVFIRRRHIGDYEPAQEMCDKFTKDYIVSRTIHVKRRRDIKKSVKPEEYSCFVAGSDQIWNPKFAGDEYYYLTFAENEQKKAYGASIGYEDIPKKLQRKWRGYWNSFETVTVREEAAARIIGRIAGRKTKVVLDPTLLLDAKEWDALSDKAVVPNEIGDVVNEDYAFVFFLGKEPEEVIEYKNTTQTCIIDISDANSELRQKVGPAEFIKLVRESSMVLTDSYHCLVFSVIYQKKYRVYKRVSTGLESMTSRMEELFKLTGLDYVMESEEYDEVKKRLEISKRDSYTTLEKMIR
ncbi:MAG: polysaccharide pyruvyl transferase family protein [Lachnobacterium sp.]|nr:polysaccharide pyruvyl transferase family protein [Lachnobacterium sp.]